MICFEGATTVVMPVGSFVRSKEKKENFLLLIEPRRALVVSGVTRAISYLYDAL